MSYKYRVSICRIEGLKKLKKYEDETLKELSQTQEHQDYVRKMEELLVTHEYSAEEQESSIEVRKKSMLTASLPAVKMLKIDI